MRAVIGLMLDTRDLRLSELQDWQRRKRGAMPKWTHHQPDSMTRDQQLALMDKMARHK